MSCGCVTVPATGNVGAFCNEVDEPCEVKYSACVDGVCVCTKGYEATHEFACGKVFLFCLSIAFKNALSSAAGHIHRVHVARDSE